MGVSRNANFRQPKTYSSYPLLHDSTVLPYDNYLYKRSPPNKPLVHVARKLTPAIATSSHITLPSTHNHLLRLYNLPANLHLTPSHISPHNFRTHQTVSIKATHLSHVPRPQSSRARPAKPSGVFLSPRIPAPPNAAIVHRTPPHHTSSWPLSHWASQRLSQSGL